jgi:hypothetical protein
MPYLKAERRQLLSPLIAPLIDHIHNYDGLHAGDLNYIICTLADTLTTVDGGIGYQKLRDILGEIHEAEEEIRRRLLVPYEAKKRHENGDVFFSDVRSA